jgi:hypothetical protein
MLHTLKNPSLLEIQTPEGSCIGGSQEWYADCFRRMSGCGPTAASNLIWYLSPDNFKSSGWDGYQALQNEMFSFVTPGMGGVNTAALFTDGLERYAKAHGIELTTHALELPGFIGKLRDIMCHDTERVSEFVLNGLRSDCPIAFLNLSNGNQTQFESWHWITILALEHESMTARVSDQGRAFDIDLAAWLRTSLLGGALVYAELRREPHL